jgi:hypothetical protein
MLVAYLLIAAGSAAGTLDVNYKFTGNRCEDATATSNAIIVCGVRPRPSPHRLYDPQKDFSPKGPADSVARQRSRWVEEGDVGTGSCGPVGPGGWTGCMQKGWRHGRQQRGWYQ